jgi:hypothetical protein
MPFHFFLAKWDAKTQSMSSVVMVFTAFSVSGAAYRFSRPGPMAGYDCRRMAHSKPVAILGEGRMVPDRIIHAKTDKPAEQKVEL